MAGKAFESNKGAAKAPDRVVAMVRARMDYNDDGVDLIGEVNVLGDEAAAGRVLNLFDRDLRRNFASMFPRPPEPEPVDLEEDLE